MGGVERGDVIYNSSGAGSAEPSTSTSSTQQQQPAAVYAVPHANRNAGSGPGAAATDALYAGYAPPGAGPSPTAPGAVYVGGSAAPPASGGGAAPEIVYATPLEDGRLVVPRMPNPLYQSADGPPNDGRSLVRVPNVMYEPAANNVYDAGVNSNGNRTTATTGNGGGGDYYDADPAPIVEHNSSA